MQCDTFSENLKKFQFCLPIFKRYKFAPLVCYLSIFKKQLNEALQVLLITTKKEMQCVKCKC